MILSGIEWQNVLVYLAYLIIFSANVESHLSHLDTVLTLLGKHGVTLKAQKCHLFSNEVEYVKRCLGGCLNRVPWPCSTARTLECQ